MPADWNALLGGGEPEPWQVPVNTLGGTVGPLPRPGVGAFPTTPSQSGVTNWLLSQGAPWSVAGRVGAVTPWTPFGAAYDVGQEWLAPALEERNPLMGAAGVGLTTLAALPLGVGARPRIPNPIRAYHGSPHAFDEFRLDRIGTGEGAQAYGHGLYFAENENIARHYRDAFTTARQQAPFSVGTGGVNIPLPRPRDAVGRYAWDELMVTNGDIDSAIERIARTDFNTERRDAALTLLRHWRGHGFRRYEPHPTAHMYEVNIHARPEQFLDWDRPLSGQSEAVRNMLHDNWLAHRNDHANQSIGAMLHSLARGHGADITRGPNFSGADARVAQTLNEAGIPGIRYLDAGSRGTGTGTSNYVIFDPNIIEILRRYGIAGPAVGVGAAGLMSDGS